MIIALTPTVETNTTNLMTTKKYLNSFVVFYFIKKDDKKGKNDHIQKNKYLSLKSCIPDKFLDFFGSSYDLIGLELGIRVRAGIWVRRGLYACMQRQITIVEPKHTSKCQRAFFIAHHPYYFRSFSTNNQFVI